MGLEYVKNKESNVVETLENSDCLKVTNLQNFIPLYTEFFKLTENNFNSINLSHKYTIVRFIEKLSYNKFLCDIRNNDDGVVQKTEIFIKYSPLIDPIKYMVGKYKNIKSGLFDLPYIDKQHICSKTDDNNNSAYIDSFFSFLTNKLLVSNNFLNGSKFYGSYLANKNDFKINIYDDIEYLDDSTFFNENKDTLFKIDKSYYDELYHTDSRNHKKHISIGRNINLDGVEDFNAELVESIFASPTKENIRILDISNNLIYNSPITKKSDDSSSCSSRVSNTSNENSDGDDEENINDNTEDSESSGSNTDSDFKFYE
jgi:hypothetical protein